MNIGVLSAANSIHTVKIVNSLAELGHQVTLYSLPGHKDVDGAVSSRVALVYLEYQSYTKNHKQLKRLLQASGAEVLYAHYATGYGTLARRTAFHPTVLAVWGSDVYDFPLKSPLHAWLLKKNLNFADALFSTSHVMARRSARYTNKPFLVTPFGVDITVLHPAEEERPKDAPLCIGFLKGVSEKYGIADLIHAFSMLTKRLPEQALHLAVYGDGDQLDEMKQLAASLGIARQVTFYGRIPHAKIGDALRSMDIFCVPSTLDSESFGVAAVEAMACGLPCVVSDVDGLCEVTVDGRTGYTVPRKDPLALCNAIQRLVLDPEGRKAMGRAGRQRVEELYHWQDNIKIIEQGLRNAIRQQ